MATLDEILDLRRACGEDDVSKYTNTDMELFLAQANGDINLAASRVWNQKASAYADLVNMSEAGSSRSNSDLFDHAVKQRDYFGGLVAAVTTPDPTLGGASTTRAITRA